MSQGTEAQGVLPSCQGQSLGRCDGRRGRASGGTRESTGRGIQTPSNEEPLGRFEEDRGGIPPVFEEDKPG